MAAPASMDLDPIFDAAAREWNVDPHLLRAVAGRESGGTPNPDQALSPKGAQGRMQIMPGTAHDLGVTDPSDPVQSIYGGAKYLSQMLDRYQNTSHPVEAALAAYNAGPGRVDDYFNNGTALPAETVAYVPGVAQRYKALAGTQAAPAATGTPLPPSGGDASYPPPASSATPHLDASLAALRQGAMPPTASPATRVAADPFSQALAAAQGGSAPSGSGAAPPAAPPPSAIPIATSVSTPSTASPAAPSDPFSQAMLAAQRAPAPTSPATPGGSPGVTPPTASAPPAGGFMATLGGMAGTVGGAIADAAHAAGETAVDASHGLYSLLNRAEALAPGLNGLDRAMGINPPAALSNLEAQQQRYAASGTADTLAGKAGSLLGQTVLTLPALGPLGTAASAAGRGIAAGADALSPALGRTATAATNLLSGTAAVPTNVLANAVVRPASLAANGAIQGATVNALTGNPENGLGHNLLTGAEIGAGLGPLAAAGTAALRGGLDVARGVVQPLTASGRGAIADRALATLAARDAQSPLTVDATSLVPGSTPTLAQATGSAGLAGAERAVASIRPNQFTDRATANNEARTTLVDGLRGTPADIEAAQLARDSTALPGITSPLANSTAPANAQPVVDAIDQILASPAGQRDAVQRALGNVRGKLVTAPTPFPDRVNTALGPVMDAITNTPGGAQDAGLWATREALLAAQQGGGQLSTLARLRGTTSTDPAYQAVIDQARNSLTGTGAQVQSDPSQLYGIRKAIGDALSPLAANAGSDAQLAAAELQQIKAHLDNAIEGAAPGFKQGLSDYAASSRPIDAMQYLQSKGFTSADGTVTLAKVRSVLDDIGKQRALPGARDAKSIPDSTVDSLQGLYADLLRQNNSRLGMQPGSNTFQNLGTASVLQGLGAPVAFGSRVLGSLPVVGNMLKGSIGSTYAAQNEPILQEVVNRLMSPDAGASVVRQANRLIAQGAAGPSGASAPFVAPVVNYLSGGSSPRER